MLRPGPSRLPDGRRPLFPAPPTADPLGARLAAVRTLVESWDDDDLLGRTDEAVAEEIYKQRRVTPIELLEDQAEALEAREVRLDASGDPRYEFPGRPATMPAIRQEIAVPVRGETSLLMRRPSTFSLDAPRARLSQGRLIFMHLGGEPSAETVRREYGRWLADVRDGIAEINTQVATYNEALRQESLRLVQARRARLLANRKLTAGLRLPVRRRADAPADPVPVRRPRIRLPAAPAGPFAPEPELDVSGAVSERGATPAGEPGPRWHFFLSYTAADMAWAEWIAWQLEDAGYRVLFQGWDFVAGSHWTSRMQEGVTGAERTLAILSRAYLGSVYGQAEWQAAYRADPQGLRRKLIPVRVEDCDRPDILGEVVSFDLFGLTAEAARRHLLDTIGHALAGRAKPATPPGFPASTPPPAAGPAFPGPAPPEAAAVPTPPSPPAPAASQPDPTVTLATAFNQLGSPALAVRLVGIRALGRVAAGTTDPALGEEAAVALGDILRRTVPKGASYRAPEDLRTAARVLVRMPSRHHLDLTGAWLSEADLSHAELAGANLTGTWLHKADLSRADLSGADLTGSRLDGADLSGADLSGANLARAQLSGANLTGTRLGGANLTQAGLSGTDLSAGQGLTQEQLDTALANRGAVVLPTGLTRPSSWRIRD